MHVDEILLSSPLRKEVGRVDHRDETVDRGPTGELDEVLEGSLRDDATDPGTKVVHLDNTATELTAVVGAVGFVVIACGAEWRTTVPATDKDILVPELLWANA